MKEVFKKTAYFQAVATIGSSPNAIVDTETEHQLEVLDDNLGLYATRIDGVRLILTDAEGDLQYAANGFTVKVGVGSNRDDANVLNLPDKGCAFLGNFDDSLRGVDATGNNVYLFGVKGGSFDAGIEKQVLYSNKDKAPSFVVRMRTKHILKLGYAIEVMYSRMLLTEREYIELQNI